jgi:hypothetical protein
MSRPIVTLSGLSADTVDQPLDTVTAKHRFGLVLPELIEFSPETDGLPKEGQVYLQIEDRFFELELKLRMLEPSWLRRSYCSPSSLPYRYHALSPHTRSLTIPNTYLPISPFTVIGEPVEISHAYSVAAFSALLTSDFSPLCKLR